jgi:hypothetical protein
MEDIFSQIILLKSIISTYNLSQPATIHRTARHLPHLQFKPINQQALHRTARQPATIHRTAQHLPHLQFKPIDKHYIVQLGI